MNLRCYTYRILDRFRFTAIATKLIYHGIPVKVIQSSCTVQGTVTGIPSNETDGDITFNLTLTDGSSRHCEVTPCAPDEVKNHARALKVGQQVEVSGAERFDPAHLGGLAGWLEIHPVTAITIKGH